MYCNQGPSYLCFMLIKTNRTVWLLFKHIESATSKDKESEWAFRQVRAKKANNELNIQSRGARESREEGR